MVEAPNAAGNKSQVRALAVGIATITATDPSTGVATTDSNGDSVFTVVVAPTPTPTHTGATTTPTRTPTPTVTATPQLVSIKLSSAAVTLKVGDLKTYTCNGTLSDGSPKNMTQAVTYVSSNPSVVEAPNAAGNKSQVRALDVGTATITATDPSTGVTTTDSNGDSVITVIVAPTPTPTHTGATTTPTRTPTPTVTATPQLVSIKLSSAAVTLKVGDLKTYTCNGTLSDGSPKNMTQAVTYVSSNPSVVEAPNAAGNKSQVRALAVGTATITALDPVTGVDTTDSNGDSVITVIVAPTPTPTHTGATTTPTRTPTPTVTATPQLVSIKLSSAAVTLKVGDLKTYTCNGTLSDGSPKNMTQAVTYVSSNPSVVEALNAAGNKSQVRALAVGSATITATDPSTGVTTTDSNGDSVITVVIAPTPTVTSTARTPTPTHTPLPTATATPKLVSIKLSSAAVTLKVGDLKTYTCNGTLSDGSPKNMTQAVTYVSSNPSVVEAPNVGGNKSQVRALAVGTATITATDPSTGIDTTDSNGDSVITVIVGPTPTPIHTGPTPTPTLSPTHTGPTDTPSLTPTPTPTETPRIVAIKLSSPAVTLRVGATKTYTCNGTLSDGSPKNMTQAVTYVSSNPSVVEAPNVGGNKSQIRALAVGTATITATDPVTGVTTTASDGDSVVTVLPAPTPTGPTPTGPTPNGPTPNGTGETPRPTVTPLAARLTDPEAARAADACQRVLFRETGRFMARKMSALDSCVYRVVSCIQLKPGDQACLDRAGAKCSGILERVGAAEAVLTRRLVEGCGAVGTPDLLSDAGLGYNGFAQTCTDLGTAISDVAGLAQCVVDRHDCRTAAMIALQVPRAPELLALIGISLGSDTCLDGVDPTGGLGNAGDSGRAVTRCTRAIQRAATRFASARLGALGRCVRGIYTCVERKVGDTGCIVHARERCDRDFENIDTDSVLVGPAIVKACGQIDPTVLRAENGAAFDKLAAACAARGVSELGTLSDYQLCLFRQHACLVEDLARFESPRIEELLDLVDRGLTASFCGP